MCVPLIMECCDRTGLRPGGRLRCAKGKRALSSRRMRPALLASERATSSACSWPSLLLSGQPLLRGAGTRRAWWASKRRGSRARFGNRRKCLLTSTDAVRTVWHRKALILRRSVTSPGVAQNKASNTARGTLEKWRTCGTTEPDGASSKSIVPLQLRERLKPAGPHTTPASAPPSLFAALSMAKLGR